jgi:hypothetical protein
MAQVWIADEVIPNSQGFNDTNTTFGAPQGLEAGRIYSRGKWSLSECLILVTCKRIDFFVYTDTNNRRTLMTTASERLAKLEENMVTRSVIRSKSQCQESGKLLQVISKKFMIIKRRFHRIKRHIFKWTTGRKKIISQ